MTDVLSCRTKMTGPVVRVVILIGVTSSVASGQGFTITTVAGTGNFGFSGDGGPATSAEISSPGGLAVDASGNLYFADAKNERIRKIARDGTISTVAGNGIAAYSGDGGPATSAALQLSALGHTSGLVVDGAENLYIADTLNSRIRKVSVNGTISTFAGAGGGGYSGDGGSAAQAEIGLPGGLATDTQGNLYFSDYGGFNCDVRKVATNGIITTVAGGNNCGYSGDGGLATEAAIYHPEGLALDATGNLFIAETSGRIRKVSTGGTITTIAGDGNSRYDGDGGSATSFSLNDPMGVAVDTAGNLFIADTNNYRIRRVDSSGTITTVAGAGAYGYSGDGGPAVNAAMSQPDGIVIDASGNAYIADFDNARIRALASPPNTQLQTGTITVTSNLPNATFTLTPTVPGAPLGGPYPVTLNSAPAGQYSIAFGNVAGYSTPSIPAQTLAGGGMISFDGEYASIPPVPQTVFLIHGIGQHASDMSGLASSLLDPTFGIDQTRFQVDSGFDFSYCAATPSCSNDCTIQSGAQALALYITQQNPSGDIVLVGYSLGGLIARDLILNNYLNVITNHHVAALITLGTPNLGYPYDPIVDPLFVCNNLAGQMFGDFRNDATAAPALPAAAGPATDFTDHNGSTVALSGYLYNLNTAWTSGGFAGPDVWLAAAGGFSNLPVRLIDGEGCPSRNGFNDTVVCADSAAPALGVGLGLPWPWFGPQYTHTAGAVDALATWVVLGNPLPSPSLSYAIFNPPTQGDLIVEIRKLIDGLPSAGAGASIKRATRR